MIVCVCRRVTDRAIRRLVAEGAASADEVALRSGAGTECGGCRGCLVRLVAEWREIDAPVALQVSPA